MKNNNNTFHLKQYVMVLLLMTCSSLALAAEPTSSLALNDFFGIINGYLAAVFFFDVMPGEANMPFIVGWLIVGAVFFNHTNELH